MDAEEIERELKTTIQKYGEWTAHNIALSENVYTITPTGTVSNKLQRVLQIVSDVAHKPWHEMRVLDLACLEGQYAIEFALHGAKVVAIEGREANIEKSRLAKRALGLENLELRQGDVCDLSVETHGKFDVVLCLGILYHLDEPNVFSLIEQIGSTCDNVAVFDTYVSLAPAKKYTYKGRDYYGRDFQEHHPNRNADATKRSDLWSSIHNNKSVWVTKATLYNMLMRSGFTSIYECDVPLELDKPLDRITVVAIKGRPAKILSNALPPPTDSELPEFQKRLPFEQQQPFSRIPKTISRLFPRSLKQQAKRRLRTLGLMSSEVEPWEWSEPFKKRDRGHN